MDNEERIREIQGDINALKQLLANSDYKALKYAEGEISAEEYVETRNTRQSYRDQINVLEAELATL